VNLGHVYRCHTVLTDPPKEKIMLCVCVSPGQVIWLNTDARRHGDGQLQVREDEHTTLTHDCYLDCSEVKHVPTADLPNMRDMGKMNPTLLLKIKMLFNSGSIKTMPRKRQKAIANSLDALSK